ncbi:hypothetical protein V5799_021463, partial [Amblyomma americanum]
MLETGSEGPAGVHDQKLRAALSAAREDFIVVCAEDLGAARQAEYQNGALERNTRTELRWEATKRSGSEEDVHVELVLLQAMRWRLTLPKKKKDTVRAGRVMASKKDSASPSDTCEAFVKEHPSDSPAATVSPAGEVDKKPGSRTGPMDAASPNPRDTPVSVTVRVRPGPTGANGPVEAVEDAEEHTPSDRESTEESPQQESPTDGQ